MRVQNFDGFLNESAQSGSNKFILMRFANAPDMRVTRLFATIASSSPKPVAMPVKAPGGQTAVMTMFNSNMSKEELVAKFDELGISYNLYQVVHDSAGGARTEGVARNLTKAEIKAKLAKAIEREDYAEAARLRDQLKQMERPTTTAPSAEGPASESMLHGFDSFLSESEDGTVTTEEFNKLVSKLVDHELSEIEAGEEGFMKETCEKIKSHMVENGMYVAAEEDKKGKE